MEKIYNGKVRWFDKLSGEGVIRVNETLVSIRVFGCNMLGAKTGLPQTACMYLIEGQLVNFKIDSYLGAYDVAGGQFDAEKWASLDQDSLIFKKNEAGEFVSGLFSNK